MKTTEAVTRRCSVKRVFLKISHNSQEKQLCQSLLFNKTAGFNLQLYLKKSLALVLSHEFGEIFKNSFFNRTRPMVVFEATTFE